MAHDSTNTAGNYLSLEDPLVSIIKNSRNKLMALFDGIDDEILVVNREYIIENINIKKADRIGLHPKDIVGKRCYSLFSPGDKKKPCSFCSVKEIFEEGQRITKEIMEKGKDGSRRFNEYTFFPINSSSGSPTHVVVYCRDIADMKARRRLEKQMIQSDKLSTIGAMVAGIAHELNNPIGVVCTNVENLQYDLEELCAPLREENGTSETGDLINEINICLADIGECAARVQKICLDLREFSRMDQREQELIDINKHLDKTLNMATSELKNRITVKREYGEIPHVKGYPTQIGQVFLNILVNASHAIREKGTITLRTSLEDSEIKVEISDTGKGIPKNVLPNIFGAFFTTKKLGKGTGLGLSISQDIIAKHHGRIEVTSKVGKGTSFFIYLPTGSLRSIKKKTPKTSSGK